MVLLYLFWQYRAYFSVRYCPNTFLTHQALGQLICQPFLAGAVQMAVDIGCGLDIAVAHPLLYVFETASLIQQ